MILPILAILPYFITAAPTATPSGGLGTISVNALDAKANTTDATNYTTNSFTPSDDALLIVACTTARGGSVDPGVATITDSVGLAWIQIADFASVTTGTQRSRLAVYVAMVPTGTSMTITSTYGGTTLGCIQNVFEVLGSDLNNGVPQTFVQTLTSTVNSVGTAAPTTLSAAGSSHNRSFHITAHWSNEDTTPASGWAEINDVGHGSPQMRLQAEWSNSAFDTAATATWPTSCNFGSVALEIKAE